MLVVGRRSAFVCSAVGFMVGRDRLSGTVYFLRRVPYEVSVGSASSGEIMNFLGGVGVRIQGAALVIRNDLLGCFGNCGCTRYLSM